MALTVPSGGVASRGVAVVLMLAAALLATRTTLGFALTGSRPALAATIDSGNAGALTGRAQLAMLAAEDDAGVAEAERRARLALLASPLETMAMRQTGFVFAATEREAKARQLLTLAGRLDLRDPLTHAWLLDDHFKASRVVEAVAEADIVLRQDVRTWPVVLPALAGLIDDPRTHSPLVAVMARRPRWRSSLLHAFAAPGVDRDAAFAILTGLTAAGAPADTRELTPWFQSIAAIEPRLLERRWRALLPRPLSNGQGVLRDGDFSGIDAPPPFTWSFFPRDGVYAERSAGPDQRNPALYLSFDATGLANFATQKLLLAPGAWRLSGRAFGDGDVAPDRFAVTLRCGEAGAVLASVPIAPRGERWTPFALDVTVPATCASQHVWFVGEPGEVLDQAAIWVDDVTLARR